MTFVDIENLVNTCWNRDCLEMLPEIPSGSIDLVLTDLPFNVTANSWDKMLPLDELFKQYLRVIKSKGAILLFANEIFSYYLISAAPNNFRYKWYWRKNTGTNFFHAKRMPVRHIEEILVFSKKGSPNYYPQKTEGHVPTNSGIGRNTGNCYSGKSQVNYLGGDTTRFPINVLEFSKVDNYSRLHPNEKPVLLLEYLIKTYTQPNEIVLDSTAGVFSTAVAAKNLGRNYIMIENDTEHGYFNKGLRRLT
jgi:site-specific DNA-methyltransferase (adenine-specific)